MLLILQKHKGMFSYSWNGLEKWGRRCRSWCRCSQWCCKQTPFPKNNSILDPRNFNFYPCSYSQRGLIFSCPYNRNRNLRHKVIDVSPLQRLNYTCFLHNIILNNV